MIDSIDDVPKEELPSLPKSSQRPIENVQALPPSLISEPIPDRSFSTQFELNRPQAPQLDEVRPYSDYDPDYWLQMEGEFGGSQSSTGSRSTSTFGGNPGVRVRYVDLLRARLNQNKRYPATARRESVEGTAILFLHIRRDGSVVEAYIQRSTGSDALDAKVSRMVERAQPFPPFKREATTSSMKLTIPIDFSIIEES